MDNIMYLDILAAIIVLVGFFFMGLCYYTVYFTESSGVAFLGGIIVAVGFLLTPYKWLALLGLLDFGVWALPYSIINDIILEKKIRKKFDSVYLDKEYQEKEGDEARTLLVRIPEREEELEWNYWTRFEYRLRIPKLIFSICHDQEGNRYLVSDTLNKGSEVDIFPFTENVITIAGLKAGKEKHTVEIEIKWKKSERPESKRRVFFDDEEDIENPEADSNNSSEDNSDNSSENNSNNSSEENSNNTGK